MLTHAQVVRLIFGLKLRQLRQERSFTPAALAQEVDVSVSYLNEIEKGKKYPKADKIMAFARVLGVSYDELVSLNLGKRLAAVSELLQSPVLREFPLDMFGLDPSRLIELVSDAPTRVMAFVSTLWELARNYEVRQEHFYLAALRSYQEMHENYFDDLEDAVRSCVARFRLRTEPPFDLHQLEDLLGQEYDYLIDRHELGTLPELQGLRSVFQPAAKRLLLRPGLSRAQEAFVLGREVAFNYLGLKDRPYTNVPAATPGSFEQVLNHFRASYFAVALLMEESQLVADLQAFFSASRWNAALLLGLLARYEVSPEMLLQRVTNLLARHFGIGSLFFLRFDQAPGDERFQLTKELHLSRLHNPHGNELQEHYCRRWVSLWLMEQARQAGSPGLRVGAQRSRYWGTTDEYLCLTIARSDASGHTTSVTVGLPIDQNLRQKVAFLDDEAIPTRWVNETCERCSIPDCEVRAAPPVVINKQLQRQALTDAVAALVRGQ
ncbi:helix-turn-helix domain-containing protein [Hymenobacter busanensis]|uniref:Helix-turn-helix domain-containing protein n=1 Tax=Hymenobacter busanensis TaxID=2607656 RepID=A0A7L5A187_9BACT|nr:helix-turn-helix transcriptional regulator [Hymenobacter busanensis]KAA9338288.1 helix-turn-helix domain-containing protein [Hymenobacter busanensis]QHJ09288.1 helix-turn-helix domain-containing protein [Hymenobacter busanensis]